MTKIKLTDLDPHFIKRVSPVDYEHTDDIREANGLQLQCPTCHWVDQRTGSGKRGHTIVLWHDPERWEFVGHGYRDLSLMAGRLVVTLSGGCKANFYIERGKVDFYSS